MLPFRHDVILPYGKWTFHTLKLHSITTVILYDCDFGRNILDRADNLQFY
jgi:hypothetical protein